jgi:hypothetical protein
MGGRWVRFTFNFKGYGAVSNEFLFLSIFCSDENGLEKQKTSLSPLCSGLILLLPRCIRHVVLFYERDICNCRPVLVKLTIGQALTASPNNPFRAKRGPNESL